MRDAGRRPAPGPSSIRRLGSDVAAALRRSWACARRLLSLTAAQFSGETHRPALPARPLDRVRPERLPRPVLVVHVAPDRQVGLRLLATERPRLEVIELEPVA
jgi:hypothetical protein